MPCEMMSRLSRSSASGGASPESTHGTLPTFNCWPIEQMPPNGSVATGASPSSGSDEDRLVARLRGRPASGTADAGRSGTAWPRPPTWRHACRSRSKHRPGRDDEVEAEGHETDQFLGRKLVAE